MTTQARQKSDWLAAVVALRSREKRVGLGGCSCMDQIDRMKSKRIEGIGISTLAIDGEAVEPEGD